jgi:hypothetical protein
MGEMSSLGSGRPQLCSPALGHGCEVACVWLSRRLAPLRPLLQAREEPDRGALSTGGCLNGAAATGYAARCDV